MTALALVALLLPIVAAIFLLPSLPRGNGSRLDVVVARIALATGIGLGMSSTMFFISLLLFDGALWSVLAFDLVPLALAAFVWLRNSWWSAISERARRGGGRDGTSHAQQTRISLALSLLFGAILLTNLVGFVLGTIGEPHGQWDAWAIWNTKARFLASGAPNWRFVFSQEAITPDYPLLLPGAIARAWRYAGDVSPLVSIFAAGLFATATIGLAVAALTILRGRAQGLIGGLLLAPLLLAEGTHLYADVPLSFYVLATVVLLALHDRFEPVGKSLPLLAGLTAGMAAWTKNEGLVFLIVALATRSFWTLLDGTRAKRTSLLWFSLASLPFVMLVVFLKLSLLESAAPMTFLRWDAVSAQLFDPVRYWRVMVAVAGMATTTTLVPLVVVVWAALQGFRVDAETRNVGRMGISVLALMTAAYFAAYVVTPHDLAWHVSTTLNRLLTQILPLAAFTVLLVTASPDERRRNAVESGSTPTHAPDRPSPRRKSRSK